MSESSQGMYDDGYEAGYEAGRAAMAAEASRIFMEVIGQPRFRRYQELMGAVDGAEVRHLHLVENLGQ